MQLFDVAIVGGGPAGSSCGAFCAMAGLQSLVIDREKFPREKVCGDCLNPSCWPVLERLELAERVRDLPHSKLCSVEFISIDGRGVTVDLPSGADGEISVKRSLFDDLLLRRAARARREHPRTNHCDGVKQRRPLEHRNFFRRFFSGSVINRCRWTQLYGGAFVQFVATSGARTCGVTGAYPAAARLWEPHRSTISARRLFGPGFSK